MTVRPAGAAELAPGTRLRDAVFDVGLRWQAGHRMPPMRFVVELTPLVELSPPVELSPLVELDDVADCFVVVVAERDGALVGFGSAVPVPARGRVFVEHFVRAPDAPNGTVELIVDAVMRAGLAAELTLGLAPLAGQVARWLRIARWMGGSLYRFAGLRAFKAKLRPDAWEPVYLCTCGTSTLVALRDALRAFAGGSLVAYAGQTIAR